MTESKADEILEKVNRCHRRIVDSSYCERSDCEQCDCFVLPKDIQTAREVLKLRGDKSE